jgi:hypothetical protein
VSAQAGSAYWRDGRVSWPGGPGAPADVIAVISDPVDENNSRIVMPSPHRNGFVVRGNYEHAADVTGPRDGQLLVFATVDEAIRAVVGEPQP